MVKPLKKYALMGFGFLLLAIALFPGGNTDKIESIDRSKLNPAHPIISIPFRIFDDNGKFIKNLERRDIELKVNNIKRTDYSLKRDFSADQWLLVMAVVDTSGSMRGKPLQDEKNALKTFAQNLGIYDKIALLTFNKTPVLQVPFTREKSEFSAKINSMMTGGNTSLYDAIAMALQLTGGTLAPRKAVVVTSDGKDTSSKIKYEDLLNKIDQAGIPVYTIALGQKNEKILKRISNDSGGIYYFSPSSGDLLDIYFKIGENLKNIYVIEGLRLSGLESTPEYKIEITNRVTGKSMIYHFVHSDVSRVTPQDRANALPGQSRNMFKLPGLKQVIAGKNDYITVGLAFFILILILLTWIFFRRNSPIIKTIVTLLFLLLYVVLQYIFFIVVK